MAVDTADLLNVVAIVLFGSLVFFMQAGFALLETGGTVLKNASVTLIKNTGDFLIASIMFYIIGFGLSSGGDRDTVFAGNSGFFPGLQSSAIFFFLLTFAGTASTIISGCLLERAHFEAYFMATAMISMFSFPVVSHWVFSSNGWLNPFSKDPLFGTGAIDLAGAGPVHLLGGISGLVGTMILGPRASVNFKKPPGFSGHSIALNALGMFCLWFGWYGFNCGSAMILPAEVLDGKAAVVALVAANTTLAGSAGGLGAMITFGIRYRRYDLSIIFNGILCGLAASTSGCADYYCWASIIVGGVAGALYVFTMELLRKLKIDDPIDAIAVHATGGAWGLFAAGFLVTDVLRPGLKGVFYGSGKVLAANMIEILAITAWASSIAFVSFYSLYKLGILKLSRKQQKRGMDVELGMSAYPELDGLMRAVEQMAGLSQLLDSKHYVGLRAFHRFLVREHAEESLDFIVATRQWSDRRGRISADKEGADDLRVAVRTEFKAICTMYVAKNAPKEINISAKARDTIMSTYEQMLKLEAEPASEFMRPLPELGIFFMAEADLITMLQNGPFKRFRSKLLNTSSGASGSGRGSSASEDGGSTGDGSNTDASSWEKETAEAILIPGLGGGSGTDKPLEKPWAVLSDGSVVWQTHSGAESRRSSAGAGPVSPRATPIAVAIAQSTEIEEH